jgi:antibiotic biosynthesis monooxygenase (ABM) superfamily enzyme
MHIYPPVRQLRPLNSVHPRPRTSTRAQAAAARPSGPPRYKLALITWVAAYPTITAILGLLGPEIGTWPLALRTLVVSVLMVATLTWIAIPGLTRAVGGWLRSA